VHVADALDGAAISVVVEDICCRLKIPFEIIFSFMKSSIQVFFTRKFFLSAFLIDKAITIRLKVEITF
jgi:hypothetical protein